MELDKLVIDFENRLFEIAREIIIKNNNLNGSYKDKFLDDPDAVEEHEPKWHQWGIITHSKKSREMYDSMVPSYLTEWDVYEKIRRYLGQDIDGIPKSELIRIAKSLHDIGKFMKGLKSPEKFDFDGHEKESERIILDPDCSINQTLNSYGLKFQHIEYIARCAGKHSELGKIRKEAKKTVQGYTLDFIEGKDFDSTLGYLIPGFKDFEIEIGLLFLSDSLAKTDVNMPATELLFLRPKLRPAIEQMPINLAAAKRYLSIVS